MASIKCKSCGKRYSYHDSDLCPHCGAYNKPASRMRVDFDQEGNAELLHEQDFLRQSEAGRRRKDCYEQKECHEDDARQVKKGTSLGRDGAGDTGKKTVEVIGVLLLVLLVLVFVFGLIQRPHYVEGPDIEIVPEAPAEKITSVPVFYYELGEQFVIDGQPVRVETVAFDMEELQATVYWENEDIYTPELYVFYEDGSELFTFTWYEDNVGGNLWQYGYTDEGFGWENVTEAYLSFTNYGDTADSYYEVRVNITDMFQNTI